VTFRPSANPTSLKPCRKARTKCAESSGVVLLRNATTGIGDCCARAASGHAAADPAIPLMKSRRRIAFTEAGLRRIGCDYSRDLRPAKWGSEVGLQGSNPEPLMSALGQKRTFSVICVMSALPPKADIPESDWHVRFVPKADIRHPSRSPRRQWQAVIAGWSARALWRS